MEFIKIIKTNGGRIVSAKVLEDGTCELVIEQYSERGNVKNSEYDSDARKKTNNLYDNDEYVRHSDR